MSEEAATDWSKLGQEAISEIIEWTKGAKDFVSEQAPELVREVLAWGFWSNVIAAITEGVVCIVAIFCFVKLLRWLSSKWDGRSNNLEVAGVLGGIGITLVSLVFFGMMVKDIWQAAYVAIAPRMYLLEYLSKLVK